MQIYYLDHNPIKSAQYHTDIHVGKMLTEGLQILSTVCHIHSQETLGVYKPTHRAHPSVVWTAETIDNYLWLYDMTEALYEEYKSRFGKTHLAGEKFKLLGIPYIKRTGLTPIRYGFKNPKYQFEDRVNGYRKYLICEKSHLIKYTNRQMPDWIREEK
jgi:hypothetical protein